MKNWKRWLVLFFVVVLTALIPVSADAAPSGKGKYSVGKGGNWQTVNGRIYYYGKDGRKASGWVEIHGTPYYFGKNGAMKAGWLNYRGRFYHYGRDGVCHTGWFEKDGRRYYCDPKKGKLYGWNEVEGDWYSFRHSGSAAVNKWIPDQDFLWYVNSEGKAVKRAPRNHENDRYDTVLMVGGSRFRHMADKYGITAENVQYIAQGGAKVGWLKEIAYPEIQKAVVKGKKTAIVFNMGLNDMEHVDIYLRFYNEQLAELLNDPSCDLFMMSVNPIDEKKYDQYQSGGNKHNWQVCEFNRKMRSQLDSRYRYIDTYQYLSSQFDMATMTVWDGIHYTRRCSRLILRQSMRFINGRTA